MTIVEIKRLAQRLRVPLGFALAPLFVISARPTPGTLACGAIVAGAGVGVRAWASGHLRKMQELTTTGPYAYTRNPLYFGTFLIVAGVLLAGGNWWLAVAVGGLFLAVYVPVMLAEVDTMRALFPESYDRWAEAVPLFFPRLTPATGASPARLARFDPRLYLGYREYRAALGLVAVLGVLAAKMFWMR